MDNVMISKIKARLYKLVNLSRFKHHWSKSMIKLFQSLGTGAVPVWCSRDSNSNLSLFFPHGRIAQLVERFTSVKRSRVRVPL